MDKKRFIGYLLTGVAVVILGSVYFGGKKEQDVVGAVQETPEQIVEKSEQSQLAPADYDMQKKIDYYTQQIASGTDDGWNYYQRGLVYQEYQQYRAAIQDYTRVLNITPETANAYANRAFCYTAEGMVNNALEDYAAALSIKPDDANIYNSRGLLYAEKKEYPLALADYNKAIELNPKFDRAFFNLGTLHERQNQFTEALAAYNSAIEFNTADSNSENDVAAAKIRLEEAYTRRALVKLSLADLDGALTDINHALELNPKNPKAYRARAAIYDKMGNVAEAASDVSTAENLGLENLMGTKQP